MNAASRGENVSGICRRVTSAGLQLGAARASPAGSGFVAAQICASVEQWLAPGVARHVLVWNQQRVNDGRDSAFRNNERGQQMRVWAWGVHLALTCHGLQVRLVPFFPGSAAEAFPEAERQQLDRSHLSKHQKRKAPGWKLAQDDARLDRRAMRLGPDGQGAVQEQDWATQAPEYAQATSSRAYVMGVLVGVLSPEGQGALLTTGWVEKAELPRARPRR